MSFRKLTSLLVLIAIALIQKTFAEDSISLTLELPEADSLAITQEEESELLWIDARNLMIEGKAFEGTDTYYERVPERLKEFGTTKASSLFWGVTKHPSGFAVRFVTDSKSIGAVWDGGTAMNHMAATGNSGLDLYIRENGEWVFSAVGRPKETRTVRTIKTFESKEEREFLLYLPLYSVVTEMKIGFEPGSAVRLPEPRREESSKPIVFYGTSITQGGCASRAGMAHAAILSRWLDYELINLGFSGSGKMEEEMAHLLAELDPALYVLEATPNMTIENINERYVPFVRILREAHPETPILCVEHPVYKSNHEHNQAMRSAFEELEEEGVKGLYYIYNKDLQRGKENGTVDGIHMTDLGFYWLAQSYYPVMKDILEK